MDALKVVVREDPIIPCKQVAADGWVVPPMPIKRDDLPPKLLETLSDRPGARKQFQESWHFPTRLEIKTRTPRPEVDL